jgi:hypothetical protein
MHRTRLTGIALVVAFGLSCGTAAADSASAPTYIAICDGQPVTFADQASGTWASVKVYGTNTTFIPTSLILNGNLLASHPATAPFPEATCTTSHPEGTLTFTGFFVPPRA